MYPLFSLFLFLFFRTNFINFIKQTNYVTVGVETRNLPRAVIGQYFGQVEETDKQTGADIAGRRI